MNYFIASVFLLFMFGAATADLNTDSSLLRVCYYCLKNPDPKLLNATLCTHIIAGFSGVRNGVIDLGGDESKALYLQTTALKKQNPQLKVLITVGGGGNADGFSSVCASPLNRTRFIFSTLAVLASYNFDGLDIDWEFPAWNDYVREDKENFIQFLGEFKVLSTAYAKVMGTTPALLSVAVAAPHNIVEDAYDIPSMAKYVDFINLMTYDFHDYNWYTPFTGHNSPLFNRTVEKAYFATLNTAWSAYYWFDQGMPKSKIMVGIPTYGHTYTLFDPNLHAVDDPAVGSIGDVTYSDVCKFLKNGGVRVFDNESLVPYAYSEKEWISYEDPVSITGKAKWIKSNGFGGAMTYDLNADDWSCACNNTPFTLHNIIYDIFTH